MLKKANVAVLVSGGGTNLQAIIDAKKAGKIPCAELCAIAAQIVQEMVENHN